MKVQLLAKTWHGAVLEVLIGIVIWVPGIACIVLTVVGALAMEAGDRLARLEDWLVGRLCR